MIRAKGVRQWAEDSMRSRLGSAASETQMTWWANELMGKTSARAAYGASASKGEFTPALCGRGARNYLNLLFNAPRLEAPLWRHG